MSFDKLICAVIDSKYEIVENILKTDSSLINYQTDDGNTAIFHAVSSNNFDMVKLIGKLCDISYSINKSNNYGMTPIILALENNNFEMISWFIHNFDLTSSINCCTMYGEFPLFVAVNYNNIDIVKMIMDKYNLCESINKEYCGRSVIDVAYKNKNLDMIKLLSPNNLF